MSAQFFDAALRAHPEIVREISEGRFDALRSWLTANIYRHGRKLLPAEKSWSAPPVPRSAWALTSRI